MLALKLTGLGPSHRVQQAQRFVLLAQHASPATQNQAGGRAAVCPMCGLPRVGDDLRAFALKGGGTLAVGGLGRHGSRGLGLRDSVEAHQVQLRSLQLLERVCQRCGLQ